MIAYLKGSILKKFEKSFILEVNGIGYDVNANSSFLSEIKENDEIETYIHTHVREDDISLYGFLTHKELRLFKLLISVSGIGPKIGMELLNQQVELIEHAIFTEDVALLSKTPGLGKKTSQKLILELKNKVEPSSLDPITGEVSNNMNVSEITDALENLGYSRPQIARGLKKIDGSLETEEVIKEFLKQAYEA